MDRALFSEGTHSSTSVLTRESAYTDICYRDRALIFIALASTWFAPFVHKISRDGLGEAVQAFAVGHTTIMVLLDFVALLFYATHIPEKWCPHTFDIWASGLS